MQAHHRDAGAFDMLAHLAPCGGYRGDWNAMGATRLPDTRAVM
jgi:hypothetical protein